CNHFKIHHPIPLFCFIYVLQCFCGEESDDPSRLGESRCTMACAGDDTQTCGGRNAISVYDCKTDREFLGCWRDSKSARIMDVVESNAASMTNEVSELLCSHVARRA
ncbi:unnamed protein product, partial [Laminaria digitata]